MITPQLIHQTILLDVWDNDKVELFHVNLKVGLIFLQENYKPGFQVTLLNQCKYLRLMQNEVLSVLVWCKSICKSMQDQMPE